MTRIDFHFNVQTPLLYACRLIRKAYHQGLKPVIYNRNLSTLEELDNLLWTFSETDFMPHALTGHVEITESPIVLTNQTNDIHAYDVLINFDNQCPAFFARFDRLVEIVSTEEENKQQARKRFQFYKERGYPIYTHDQHKATKHQEVQHG